MAGTKVRKAQFAGQFYSASPSGIRNQIEGFLSGVKRGAEKTHALACILPHAGYMYSGRVAVETVAQIDLQDTAILLGPNHTGNGAGFSIMAEGTWQTPLGEVRIDSVLARKMLDNSAHLQDDSLAHAQEHSLEVELPILQYFKPDIQIVPITFLSDDADALKETGREIAGVIKESKKPVTIVASSDMTHYEPQKYAERKDREAIQAILELDADKLMQKVRSLHISMCGYAPVVVMISIAKALGAKFGKLINYETSGEITNDRQSVVGYAGIAIY